MQNKTTRWWDICGFTPSCCLDIYSTLYFIYISLWELCFQFYLSFIMLGNSDFQQRYGADCRGATKCLNFWSLVLSYFSFIAIECATIDITIFRYFQSNTQAQVETWHCEVEGRKKLEEILVWKVTSSNANFLINLIFVSYVIT